MMEDLIIERECETISLSGDDKDSIFDIGIHINNRRDETCANCVLDKDEAIQLRDWLNERLDKHCELLQGI